MLRITKYAVIAASLAVVLAPSLAFAQLVEPTVPVGGVALTGENVIDIITTIVNDVIIVSVTIAVGMFVYGGIRYAMGHAEAADTMKNAAWGLLAILAVGLVVNTIKGLVDRGGFLG